MSCFQITAYRPIINVSVLPLPRTSRPSMPCPSLTHANCLPRTSLRLATKNWLPRKSLRLATNTSTYQQCTPVCLFGGKEKSKNDNDASPWKSLENAMGSFKKDNSIEDVLRQQIEKQEYFDDGGSGGIPPLGGGGGGGGSGESEDEGFAGIMDEFLQVILATIGFIFLYMYIITGEELARLAKDYIKFLFGANKSVRLRRAMYKWGKFYRRLTERKVTQKYWLEQAILNTETWYDSPAKYRQVLRNYFESTYDQ